MACGQLMKEIEGLEIEKHDLQALLHEAAPGNKAGIVALIDKINDSLHEVKQQLEACLTKVGLQNITATLSGTVTLTTTDDKASGPFTEQVKIKLFFSNARQNVEINEFQPIVTKPFDTPYGKNVTTITKDLLGSNFGTSNPKNGELWINCTLKFDHKIDVPLFEEDSTLNIVLTTGKVGSMKGSPINQVNGAVKLVGSGTFKGGYLKGEVGNIVISGKINPIP
jgi:hypothetical protein